MDRLEFVKHTQVEKNMCKLHAEIMEVYNIVNGCGAQVESSECDKTLSFSLSNINIPSVSLYANRKFHNNMSVSIETTTTNVIIIINK